LTENQLY